jgi:SET domain-containing protein
MKLYKQKSSNIDNRGLFASKNIRKGTKIIYYTGKIITKTD